MKVLITILFALSIGSSMAIDQCPSIQPLKNFDFNKFKGTWYEIEKLAQYVDPVYQFECIELDYDVTKIDDGWKLVINKTSRWASSKKWGSIYATTNVRKLEDIKDIDIRFYMGLTAYHDYRYTVIDTDYDTYAIIYSCINFEGKFEENAFLLSRTRTLDQSLAQNLKDLLRFRYSVNDAYFRPIEQLTCA